MPSFQISVTPNRRAAARFIGKVRRSIQQALADNPEITQTEIAGALDVHRSVINRQVRGFKDMTLGRVGELAWALGYEPEFKLVRREPGKGQNVPAAVPGAWVKAGCTKSSRNYLRVTPSSMANTTSKVRSEVVAQ